jgi:hypothetical protein
VQTYLLDQQQRSRYSFRIEAMECCSIFCSKRWVTRQQISEHNEGIHLLRRLHPTLFCGIDMVDFFLDMFHILDFHRIWTDLPGDTNTSKYTYKEIVKATENFNPSNKIGEGGFGSVYKGRLRNGKLIAAKVLSIESRQGLKEFTNELMAISNISHGNLVSLYGYCVEGNKRILVYNYLENNSLAQTLLGNSWLLKSFSLYCFQFTYFLYKV